MDGRSNVRLSTIRPTDGLKAQSNIKIYCSTIWQSIHLAFLMDGRLNICPTVRRSQRSNPYLNNLFVIRHSTIWETSMSTPFQGRSDKCSTLNFRPPDGPKSQTSMQIKLFDIRQSEKVLYQVLMSVRPKTIFNISASPTLKFDRMTKLDYLRIFCFSLGWAFHGIRRN